MSRAAILAQAVPSAERLAELTRQKAELVQRLADSLALEAFAGRPIFEHGRVAVRVLGAGQWPDSSWRFELHLGNGESLAWPLFEVPSRFWPKLAARWRGTPGGRSKLASLEAKESAE